MAKKQKKRLTPLESLIMDRVWQLSEVTVRQVQEELSTVKPMAYNTVLTMMRILRKKGFLESERAGRMDLYRPIVTREEMGKGLLSDLLERFYSGSTTALVSQLLDLDALTSREVKAIRKQVDARLRNANGSENQS